MATSPQSFAIRPRILNYEVTKLKNASSSFIQNKGTHFPKRMHTPGKIECKIPLQDVSGITRRDSYMNVCASSQSSTYQIGTESFTSIEIEELKNVSTYLFRANVGGQVKVYVGMKDEKYLVCIEVFDLPKWVDNNKLELSWKIYRSVSSPLRPLNIQKASLTKSNTYRTPLLQKSPGKFALEMEFESDQAPFYLSFQLESPPDTSLSNLEIKSNRSTNFCVPVGISSGYSDPLGISFFNDGSVNFALFSRNAGSVALCLYGDVIAKPSLEIELDPYINRTGDIWHIKLESVAPYKSYGYRCHGAIPQDKGDLFHASHVLLDPYAKIVQSLVSDHPGSIARMNCLGYLLKEPSFDWSGEVRPCLPLENLVVYRLSVEGFTRDKSSKLQSEVAGTFTGLIEKVHHFKALGVNAVLLEPIFSFDEQKGPYYPYHFFSPMSSYGPTRDGISAITSMKEMVKAFHANNIEILLEVVFTHTAEGGDSSQTIGLRGIDNSSYYVKNVNLGAGSVLNCNYPIVQQLVLDSLRHWVSEFHIDGFCFMNASSLLRGSNGKYLSRPPLIEAIAFDPILSKTKIIADCWKPYEMATNKIRFPHWKRWAEMNTRFCYDIRNFLRGEGLLSQLATRLCGSGDVFLGGRGPAFSFNFITKNFGLPLVDLVSFSRIDLSSELSWNCGEEGPTSNNVVLERRLKQTRNFLFVLYISLGVPVLNMGDECGQSSGGSASYSDRRSFDWDALRTPFGTQMMQFIAYLSSLKVRRGDLLRKKSYVLEENIEWHGSNQARPKWEDTSSKFLAMILKVDKEIDSESSHGGGDLFIAINAGDCPESVIFPIPSEGMAWFRLIDTALPFPGFFLTDGELVTEHISGSVDYTFKKKGSVDYEIKSHSCALFEARSLVN